MSIFLACIVHTCTWLAFSSLGVICVMSRILSRRKEIEKKVEVLGD
jgi:hypothetical protein